MFSTLKKHWVLISASIAFIFFVITPTLPYIKHASISLIPSANDDAAAFRSPKINVFADLSTKEVEDVVDFLFQKTDLNLTESSLAGDNDNQILLIEALQPNKTDVLSYLAGSAGPPARWARVAIVQSATEEARIVNYRIGPLPIRETTEILPLEFCYSSGRNYVTNPLAYQEELQLWSISMLMNVSDVTQELLGTSVDPFDPNGLSAGARFSYAENGTLIVWVHFSLSNPTGGTSTILPQGLYVQMDVSTRDSSNWKALQWYYNNVLYDTIDELRKAINTPGFKKSPLNTDGQWTEIVDFSEGNADRSKPPPTIIQPTGARYHIDEEEKFVSWMGFEFFMRTSSDTGVALHGIKFNGDSVIYELGLQEALAHYAGDDPTQGGLEFMDASFYMGRLMPELVPGYDCPAYATYLSTSYHFGEDTEIRRNSICVFEHTADYPIQRHSSATRVSVSRNTYLVVRFVSTVWNYDYTFDYIFYLDGTIEVKVRASGFIFAAFWTGNEANEDEYGFRVHDALASSMHDHVLNFKADLDVAGTDNTMVRLGIEPITMKYPWDDERTGPRNTMHLVQRPVEKETGLDWARNSGEMYIIMNQNKTNEWGEKRGYRIQPGSGIGSPIHLTILNSTALGKSASWASQDLWVLKRKDTEPKSASSLNFLDPHDPLVDFSKFVDDEDIVQDDLVIFFNLGMHHVPHTGDIPNTLMHTSSSSVMFTPFNFHDRDPSRLTSQGVQLDINSKKTKPKYFGKTYNEGVKLKKTDLEPDLTKFGQSSGNVSWISKLVGPVPWA
ncbi:amine oxidase catalytic domain-containing protein [Stipitochalara longipes BDJ]|nr:amine oxidase catalytic domain-containing protein [Stipitochalara longipes BDJ]